MEPVIDNPTLACAICGASMGADVLAGTYRCPSCGFYASTFPIHINGIEDRLDEGLREKALKPVRTATYDELLSQCAHYMRKDGSVLDVGCAHGWFLDALTTRGYNASGIEPDTHIADQAKRAGHNVLVGLFPDAVSPGQTYSVITFNDVFEHVPDLHAIAGALREHLEGGGKVIINLPVSTGATFVLARIIARAGITGPLSRLWQEGMPSPHVSYFSKTTLKRLMEGHSFVYRAGGRLTSISVRGLWQRIRYDRSVPYWRATCIYPLALGFAVVSRFLPSDIQYFVFEKQ